MLFIFQHLLLFGTKLMLKRIEQFVADTSFLKIPNQLILSGPHFHVGNPSIKHQEAK